MPVARSTAPLRPIVRELLVCPIEGRLVLLGCGHEAWTTGQKQARCVKCAKGGS